MINTNFHILNIFNKPVRNILGMVEHIKSARASAFYFNTDKLKEFTVERVGEEGKFFGFGICQKANIKLINTSGDLVVTTADDFRIYLGCAASSAPFYPTFRTTEVHKDENTGELSVTAYDAIYRAAEHTTSELETEVTDIVSFAEAIASFLGCAGVEFINTGASEACFNITYNETALANFEGTENLRSILDDIAEVTQTVYYVNFANKLIFKRLDREGEAVLTLPKKDYFTLESGNNRRLSNLVSTTQLGDNLKATLKDSVSGEILTIDDISEEPHEVEVNVRNKNIFDINTSRLGDLTNISSFAGIVLNPSEVREIFKPNKTYTAQFIAEGLANIEYSTVYDSHIGFLLHCRNPVKTTGVASIYRSGKNNEYILTKGKTVEVKGTFTTPDDLNINDYELLIYTQRCLDTNGAPVLNTIKFSNIQIEEGTTATNYVPHTPVEELNVTVTNLGKFVPDAKGNLVIPSKAPIMEIKTGIEGITLNATYQKANVISGTTQYIRDNPFIDIRADRAALIDSFLLPVWGMTINQFECSWRGNFLLEIGDKIDLVTKDNDTVTSYVLNDTVTYDGSFSEVTSWHFTEAEETEATPSNLGDVLKQTYAKVDKVNKEVEIVVSDITDTKEQVSQIMSNAESISARVQSIEETTTNSIDNINGEISTLTSKVDAIITAEDVQLKIETELANGVDKVTTTTGYTFNDEGLTVSKANSEMTTTISDDGMKVYRDKDEVLTADNTGVYAENLHATTYLIIGSTSRFEDYSGRTGCFWIG